METRMKRIIIIIAAIILPVIAYGQAKEFFINGQDKRDLVTFTSHAPLETIEGKTSKVMGFLEVDPADIGSAKAKIAVDLASIKTGIDMRDKHMRENHLETEKYPQAIFELTDVKTGSHYNIADGQPIDITLFGNFTVHGVTKPVEIKATVQYYGDDQSSPMKIPGEVIHIKAGFDVLLPDYEIKRPQFLVLKLDEKQEIMVDIWAATGLPKVEMSQR